MFNSGILEIVAPSPRNNNPKTSDSFSIKLKFLSMYWSWITPKRSFIYELSVWRLINFWHSYFQIKHLIEPRFLRYIERNTFRNNEIRDCNFKAFLIKSHHLLCVILSHEKYWIFLRSCWIDFRWFATACAEGWCIRYCSNIWWLHTPGATLNIRLNNFWLIIL